MSQPASNGPRHVPPEVIYEPPQTPSKPPAPSRPPDPDAESNPRFGAPLDPSRIRRVLRLEMRFLIAVASVGLLAAAIAALLLPRTYVASAVLKYGEGGDAGQGMEARVRALSDAAELLTAPEVLREVKRRTGTSDPITALKRNLEASSEIQTGLFRISATADSASGSAKLANESAQALIAELERGQRAEIEVQLQSLDVRIAGETAALDQIRGRYDAFRREHGITDLPTEREREIDSAAELRSQRDLAAAEISALEARVAQLRRDLARTPRLVTTSSSSGLSSDREQLARREAELATARGTLSPDHPTVRSLELQTDALRRRIATGRTGQTSTVTLGASPQYQMLETAVASAEAELAAARERNVSIGALAAEAATRVTQISAIEGEASQLLGSVRTHETLVEELRERRARLESRRRNPDAGLVMLTPAVRPISAESSKKKLLAVGVLPFLLVGLAALVFIGRDVGSGRLRTPAEIAYWSRFPVIASTDWPRNLRGIDDIVGDMDDLSHRATGQTLLVPLSDREIPLVKTLAERLGDGWLGVDNYDPNLAAAAGSVVRSEAPTDTGVPGPIITPPPATSTPRASDAPAGARSPTLQGFDPGVDLRADATGRVRKDADLPPPPAGETPGTNLVRVSRVPSGALVLFEEAARAVVPWQGALTGPKLRREVRLADRVAVVVSSGQVDVKQLATLRTRIGREFGVGMIVVDLPEHYLSLADRVGPVERFWDAHVTL